MKKFEIINGCWIKKLDEFNKREKQSAMKISAVSYLSSGKIEEDYVNIGSFRIYMADGQNSLDFYYMKSEEDQYRSDLTFFENLLFQ